MKKSLPLCSAIAILSAVCSPGQTPPPLRVMPLGDSITHGAHASGEPDAGGYRYPLYVALTNAGYNVDYIGTMTTVPHPGLGAEIHHEGHSGWRIVGGNNLYDNILTWLSQVEDPDVVLVHIGTNDSGDDDFTNRVDRLDDLVTRIATARPYAHIVVTTLLKRGGSDSDARYVAIANHFNPFVEQKVLAQQALGRRVHFLDMHAYLERTDMYDNLHPNPTGYAKMAAAWFPAVTNIVGPCGDRLPPGLSSVKAVSAATLTVTFSKPVNLAASPAVTNPASYAVSPAGSVTAVSLLSSDLRKVTLSLSGLTPNVTGTLSFNGTVTDLIPAAEGGPYSAILSGPAGTFVTPAASGYAAENLPAGTLDGWEPLYTLNIPNGVRYGYSPVGYALDTSANYANLPLSRVAYYLALQRVDEPLRYVWVELDAFTQEAAKLGVPTTLSGAFFQQTVSNLIVLSTSPNVTPGTFALGNIEFWPCNYHQENAPAVPGASSAIFDFGDKATNGDYGSMQLHNTAAGETLFAFNHWGSAKVSTFIPCLGIGNNPDASATASGPQRDWTFAENGTQLPTKVLQVFVKRAAAPLPRPAPAALSAHTGFSGDLIQVAFSAPLAAASVTPAAFSLDRGVTVTAATLLKDGKTVNLATTPQPAGAALTLAVSGIRDAQTGAPAPAASLPVAALPPEVAINVGPLADGYRLVYTLDIPVRTDFGGSVPAPYTFNAANAPIPFDRVAYYLEVGNRPLASPARDYVWTSMDTFTPFLSKIGVPNVAAKAVFAQPVSNLTVKSSKSTVTAGDYDTGNIEFWPSNYNQSNANNVPGASATVYDFGDGGYGTSAGHGSMQVHNPGRKQTLLSMTHWGTGNGILGLGIGNCPADQSSSGSGDLDWTFAENTASYSHRRLHVLARPKLAASPPAPPAEILARVPDAAGFSHLYTIDIPLRCTFSNAAARASYYTADHSDLFRGPHARVAYYLELVKNNVTSFCWTAFDPVSPGVKNLGVPVNDNYFWQTVTNLDVFSNVPGVVNTNGCDTGNIEFWDRDYQNTNAKNIPGASDSVFDFGDKRGDSPAGYYGSMQVHNYGAGQVLWAISRFNRGTENVNIGIGNNPNGSQAPDYTHTGSGANWDSRRLLVFVKPEPPAIEIPPGVAANVPDAADFKHLYTIDIPVRASFNNADSNTSYYSVNNAAALSAAANGAPYGRVGYYLELVKNNATSFCWTAFDAFTADLTQLGAPRSGKIYQQLVNNLDVLSNVPGVLNTNGCGTGNIEFWDWNYGASGNQSIPGGSDTLFDFADSCSGSGNYGSMQVHNWSAGQTLWAVNHFNANAVVCVGIGNNPNASSTGSGPQRDWTFAENAASWDSRRLLVFVRPGGAPAADTSRPAPSRAVGQTSLDRALVVFDKPVEDAAAAPANFTADKGLAVLGAVMHPAYSNTCVVLTTTPQTPGTVYTLTVNNVFDRSPLRNAMFPNRTVSFTAQTEASARPDFLAGIPEAAGYRLVQKLTVTRSTRYAKGAPFSLDDTWPKAPPFDRVAYALDLPGTNGVRRWIWASMDSFTTDPLRVGLPTCDRAARFQQVVSNLTVAVPAAVTEVTAGDFPDGNIEFWPNNYSEANEAGIPGADGSVFDFGDRIDPGVPFGYGSMQVHNFRLGQTLFAVNDWGTDNRSVKLGIGNRPTGAPDWTHADDASSYNAYASRTLYVFVRPAAAPLSEPVPVPGWGTVPVIGLSPADQLVDLGAPAVFAVVASGAERYQWRKNGVFIPGATSAFLEIPEARGRDIGDYDVLVYGSGSRYAVSVSAHLSVDFKGTILLLK